jgi:hypothetical protein
MNNDASKLANSNNYRIKSTGLATDFEWLIEIIIKSFIKSGSLRFSDYYDIKQTVIEKLLLKEEKIKNQFQGMSKFSSYMSVIIQNECNELIRQKNRMLIIDKEINHPEDIIVSTNPENLLVIKQEISRLNKILNMYYHSRNKIILCLKLKYRIPLCFIDFSRYNNQIKMEEYQFFLTGLNPYITINDYELYSKAILVFNKYEEKENSPDALRKFIQLKTSELILLLNGSPPTSFYNEETFQILFEKYCDHRKE